MLWSLWASQPTCLTPQVRVPALHAAQWSLHRMAWLAGKLLSMQQAAVGSVGAWRMRAVGSVRGVPAHLLWQRDAARAHRSGVVWSLLLGG